MIPGGALSLTGNSTGAALSLTGNSALVFGLSVSSIGAGLGLNGTGGPDGLNPIGLTVAGVSDELVGGVSSGLTTPGGRTVSSMRGGVVTGSNLERRRPSAVDMQVAGTSEAPVGMGGLSLGMRAMDGSVRVSRGAGLMPSGRLEGASDRARLQP